MRRIILILVLLSMAGLPAGRSSAGPGLPATEGAYGTLRHTHAYPVLDGAGSSLSDASWRVAHTTGNCCENYVTITPDGTIVNLGGNTPVYSSDRGQTWKTARPNGPLLGAEGAVSMAPNGDIVGMTWDPYTGDRVITFKRDAATGAWSWSPLALHLPFFDRPWIGIVPGPFTIGVETGPYLVVMRGGYPFKEPTFYSVDGLTYVRADSRLIDSALNARTQSYLDLAPDPSRDWTQSNIAARVSPLDKGRALGRNSGTIEPACPWMITKPDGSWSCFSFPDGTAPAGRVAADSRGYLHDVGVGGTSVIYRLSRDGGRTWSETEAELPAGLNSEEWDFKVNGALGITAVAVHANRADPSTDQDMVFRFATGDGGAPVLDRMYMLGKGDLDFGAGIGATLRFDFDTVGILPDGKLVVSMVDGSHTQVALAIEL